MVANSFLRVDWLCKILLFLYLVGMPLFSRTILSPIVTAIGIVLAGLMLCIALMRRKLPFHATSLAALGSLIAFGVVVYASHFYVEAQVGQRALAVLYLVFIAYGIASYVAKWGPVDVFRFLVIGVSVGSAWALVTGENIALIRYSTPFGEAVNQFGGLIGFGVFAALYLGDTVARRKSVQGRIWICLAVGLTVMSLLMGSRQSLILSSIAWLYFIGFSTRRIVLLIGITYPLFVVATEMDLYIVERVRSLLGLWFGLGGTGEQSIPLRMAIISAAIEGWLQQPILGHGLQAFEYQSGFGLYTHMNYLELLYNHGIIGFALFYVPLALVLIGVIAKKQLFVEGSIRLVLFLLLFFVLRDLFIVTYHAHLTWIIFGLLLGVIHYFRVAITLQNHRMAA